MSRLLVIVVAACRFVRRRVVDVAALIACHGLEGEIVDVSKSMVQSSVISTSRELSSRLWRRYLERCSIAGS